MKIIGAFKGILGYTWAIAVIFVVAAGMTNMNYFEQKLILNNGLHVSENFTGGDIISIKDHLQYETSLHKPVFRGVGFIGSKGFIQVDWSGKALPAIIKEQVDYDGDGKTDFNIELDTIKNVAVLKPYNEKVLSLTKEQVLVYANSRSVRVLLKK